MGKLFSKIFKIFFIFLCFIVALGLILVTIKSYMITEVEVSLIKDRFYIKERDYFEGKVTNKDQNYIEIRAEQNMVISDLSIKTGQILEKDSNKLFTINTDSYFSDNQEVLEEYNESIVNINSEIDTLLNELSKKVGKEIKNVDSLNPSDGIEILAAASGKITGLNIEKGKKIQSPTISHIIDDSALIIPFTMTTNEYSTMSVGQEILVTYTGYEGYYNAKVISINPNAIPGKDKISYIYNGVIEAENPGLISPGVSVGVCTKVNGQPSLTLSYAAVVESYKENVIVTTPIFSNQNDIYPIEVYVEEGELVQKGQRIATLGGEAITDDLKASIKDIKNKMDSVSKVHNKIQDLYGDIISSNVANRIKIDDSGNCYIGGKVLIDYVTDKAVVNKNEVILKYRPCNEENLAILATVSIEMYNEMSNLNSSVTYTDSGYSKVYNAKKLDERKFDNHYEVLYELNNDSVYRYTYNDNVTFSVNTERYIYSAVSKASIIPLGELKVGANCYVYVLDKEETMFETVDVVRQKMASIVYVGSQVVQIRFYDDMSSFDQIYVVSNINTTLKDGMRVKVK